MALASPGSDWWDDRVHRLVDLQAASFEVTQYIDVADLVVGDQLVVSGEPFIVTDVVIEDPMVFVEAVTERRRLQIQYLTIESVAVFVPRPPAAERKVPA